MKSLLLFAISFLCFSPNCLTQTIWPGDVNNNGIVNEIDLLYLGFAYNEMGSPRTNASSDWIGQELTTEWDGTFPDGLNFAYADCNGDGVVNEVDAKIIETNLTETHDDVPFIADDILTAIPNIDPSFTISSPSFEVPSGGSIDLDINLGSDISPVENLLGVAFTISVDPRFFKTDRTKFELDPVAWISPFSNENTSLVLNNEAEGKITFTFTATDKKPVSGGGLIGKVSFVLIEDIVDFLVKEDTLKVAIDSITIVTDNLEKTPAVGACAELEVIGRTTSTYNPILDKIKFYPNPTNGWLLLKSKEVAIEKVELVNTLGQVVYQKQLTNSTFQSLDLQTVPEGMYWLRMITELGTKSTPIQRL